ncbi:hypothetical protein QSV34_06295 [Porticoccus sp. W117]|uniref:hypothetical protein n=1 Tax=Porticoccus sp. W117 TaxID=3054777 RepID=UPI00259619C9|nr:hypothetical protein [Porticoccus sp. W117]MDM3870963.1 hypothetical protein [Porticoccus sp. W117]
MSEQDKTLEQVNREAMREAVESMGMVCVPTIANVPLPHTSIAPAPSEEEVSNDYRSAGVLMRRLADTVIQWRNQLPEDQQPAILAVLNGGIQINVLRLAQESFHGIRIEGTINGSPCMLLSHQSSVQLLCYVEKVEKEEFRRRIGFIIDGEEEEV